MIVLTAVILLTAATLRTAAVPIATLPMPYGHRAQRDKWYIFTSSTILGIAFHINIKYHTKKQLFKVGITITYTSSLIYSSNTAFFFTASIAFKSYCNISYTSNIITAAFLFITAMVIDGSNITHSRNITYSTKMQ